VSPPRVLARMGCATAVAAPAAVTGAQVWQDAHSSPAGPQTLAGSGWWQALATPAAHLPAWVVLLAGVCGLFGWLLFAVALGRLRRALADIDAAAEQARADRQQRAGQRKRRPGTVGPAAPAAFAEGGRRR
jgi:hypothetical protein